MQLQPDQLVVSVLLIFVVAAVCDALVFRRKSRRWGYPVLSACALIAMSSWFGFGRFHSIFVDSGPASDVSPHRAKEERHRPFHFHEFFHYYVGAKYFREVGYLGLYDCTTMADHEIAEEDHTPARVTSYVRDLDDVLQDKPYPAAIQDCAQKHRDRFTPARWASFKSDLRELHRLVPDGWWNEAVFDAGFNPPPSWIVVGSAIANVIPIRAAGIPTYLLATSLDMLLLLACYLAIQASFGRVSAVLAVIFFGASFIASYAWNGGAFLRFTWITAVVLSLAAMKRGRWALAGALLGAAVCDRIFPAGFAIGAAVPLAYRALLLRSPDARKVLIRFGAGLGGTIAVLVALSCVVFGLPSWGTFFSRILRHGDVYYVMHIGLKKVLTFRDWVPSQNFQGHDGLRHFHDWNLHLRATWAEMRPLVIPIQLVAVVGAGCASLHRRPYEAALLCGVVFMFVFNLPANYYYVVLALVPALLFRSAATAPSLDRRAREFFGLAAFNIFWALTLVAPRAYGDAIVYDYWICVGLAAFLAVWIVVWLEPAWLRAQLTLLRTFPKRGGSTTPISSTTT
jgi:hypothetical protein